MKQFISVIIILNAFHGFSQSYLINNEKTKLVEEIAQKNILMSKYIGFDGAHTKQYERFETLKNKFSKKELIELTNHNNSVLRCYAYWALADRKEDNLFPVLLDHLDDTVRVERQFGCVYSEVSVADFYIELLTKKHLITEDYYRKNKSTIQYFEKEKLDSLVLYTSSNLEYLNRVLLNHEPVEKDYQRIIQIVKKGNYIGLPALAKYQKQQDLDLILSFKDITIKRNMYPHPFTSLFRAIEYFPDDYFVEFLQKYGKAILDKEFYGHYWYDFYVACAKYNSSKTLEILRNPVKSMSNIPMIKYHLRYINHALGKYPTKENLDLIILLWRKYNLVSEGSFKYLSSNKPELAFELIKKYFDDFEEVYQGGREEELIPKILPFALNYNKAEAIDLIAKNLRTNTITPFKEFAKFAKEIRSETFIKPIFYRIENEWNTYVFYEALDILLEYNSKDINERIFNSLKNNNKIADDYFSKKEIEKEVKKRIKNNKKK